MPRPSDPPPSSHLPGRSSSGGGLYLLGALLLVGAAAMLYVWKKPGQVTPQATTVTATVSAKPPVDEPVALYAPPPPPKLEELDAGVDTTKAAPKGTGGPAPVGPGPCGGSCGGPGTPALKSALSGRASSARSCYNRALRTSESLSGSMTVRVQVGPSGQVCSASLVNDTMHSNEVAMCVLGRFRGQSFPSPGECTTVDIPMNFATKQ